MSSIASMADEIDAAIKAAHAALDRMEARRIIADAPPALVASYAALVRQQQPKKTAREIAASRWGQPVAQANEGACNVSK
jgi:hypothetical protein